MVGEGRKALVDQAKADRWRSVKQPYERGLRFANQDPQLARQADLRTRKLELELLAAERRNRIEEGALVDRAAVTEAFAAVFATLRSGVMELGLTVAVEVGAETGVEGAVVRASLEPKLRAILERAHKALLQV
jgi:hypothetical protein